MYVDPRLGDHKPSKAVEGVVYPTPAAEELPKGRRWMSVRTDGLITGWRVSTEGEEYRFAQMSLFSTEQSDFETATMTEDDIESAFGRNTFGSIWRSGR